MFNDRFQISLRPPRSESFAPNQSRLQILPGLVAFGELRQFGARIEEVITEIGPQSMYFGQYFFWGQLYQAVNDRQGVQVDVPATDNRFAW